MVREIQQRQLHARPAYQIHRTRRMVRAGVELQRIVDLRYKSSKMLELY